MRLLPVALAVRAALALEKVGRVGIPGVLAYEASSASLGVRVGVFADELDIRVGDGELLDEEGQWLSAVLGEFRVCAGSAPMSANQVKGDGVPFMPANPAAHGDLRPHALVIAHNLDARIDFA